MRNLGIRGFEAILRGGIPIRAEVLLLAPEGAERHLLGAHWVLEGLNHGERVLVVLSTESRDAFAARLGRMGVDVQAALASGALVLVDWFTCWTQPVEGVQESRRTLVASRNPADLLAAVDRAVPVLSPATERRAYVDVLPIAAKALEETQARETLRELRARLSAAGVTAIFLGDRGIPDARLDALLQTFHAVLDARAEARGVLGIAVLGVGGVKRAPKYRKVRVREDAAEVEAEAAVRTFSCPICDARVPFDAQRCPSCGTLRSEMEARARPSGLMDYVEALGRKEGVAPERGRPGLTNGSRRPEGRVNGLASGRVNGIAPAGRTNGLAAGAGRTNGLVNGIRRARGGITNGLTNGSGFTNGLGGQRYRGEARVSRWKLLVVPLIGSALLLSPFLIADAPPRARYVIDGSFEDWSGVVLYEQTPDPEANASVAITGFRLAVDGRSMYLFASVAGAWFPEPDEVHALYVFIDGDGDRATGYRVPGLGADRVGIVEGSGGVVTAVSLREHSGPDPYNWTAFQSVGSGSAAVSGGRLEAMFPWDGANAAAKVLLMADDGAGSRTYSAVPFGPDPGALRVSVSRRSAVVSRGTPDVATVAFEAFGAPIEVTGLTWEANAGVGTVAPPLPVTVRAGRTESVTVRFDTSGSQPEDLLEARLVSVETSPARPVLILDDTVRAYVDRARPGKVVDGWFDDWALEVDPPGDPANDWRNPDQDLRGTAANRTGDTLYAYADVRGRVFSGTPAPVRRIKPQPGGEPSPPGTGVPARVVGEDVLRVYVDEDRNADRGIPFAGLRGADYLIEIRGIHGAITSRSAFEWRDGWRPIAAPEAKNDGKRVEASLPLASPGAVEVVFATSDWAGPADSTPARGTRGVRGLGSSYVSEGRVSATFSPDGGVEVLAAGVGVAWTLPPDPWALEPTPVGVRYTAGNAEVRYTVDPGQLKEEFLLAAPPAPGAVEFGFSLRGGALAWVEEGGAIRILSGDRRLFTLPPPFAIDARGARIDLAFDLDLAAGRLRIPLPPALAEPERYPVLVDPVVSYTLENDGEANDTNEHFGYSVAVGDFNGDGYADVLGGAPNNNKNNPQLTTGHGYAYVFYGPFSADDSTPDVWMNPQNTNSTRFGYAVAAGRFNGDQYWDALVARVSLDTLAIGNVTIFYGASGWAGEDTTPDVQFVPPQNPKNYGFFVAAGNLDNANYDDVLIAEVGRDLNGDSTADGVVYVYKSPFSGVETGADYRLVPSSNSGGQLGYAIAVGKVDSDAYPDVVVGEPAYATNQGRVQFYKGSHFTSGSGDVSPDATISAPGGGGSTWQFGFSVAVGRLNSDSYADVIVGAPLKFSNDGRAYVYYANSDGSGLTTGASASLTLTSQSAGERFGYAVLIADWSDDGTNDAIVAAPTANAGGTARGRVYWFDDVASDQTVDATLSGDQDNEFFGRALAAGKGSSDPRTILAVGAYLWDDGPSQTDNSGRVVVANVPEFPLQLAVVGTLPALVGRLWRRASRPRTRAPPRARAHR